MTDKGTCCLCLEIKFGLTILSVLMAAGAILAVVGGVMSILTFNIWAVLMLVFSLPMILAGFYCLKWLMADNADNRKLLVFAMLINIICCMFQGVWNILQ